MLAHLCKNKFVQVASLPDLHQLNQWTSIYPKRGEKAEEREIPWHHMFAQLPKSKVGENQFQHFSFKKLLFLLSANSAGGKIWDGFSAVWLSPLASRRLALWLEISRIVIFCIKYKSLFLPDPGVSGVRSMGPGVSMYLPTTDLWNFADVTLADDDTNSIQLMMPI